MRGRWHVCYGSVLSIICLIIKMLVYTHILVHMLSLYIYIYVSTHDLYCGIENNIFYQLIYQVYSGTPSIKQPSIKDTSLNRTLPPVSIANPLRTPAKNVLIREVPL